MGLQLDIMNATTFKVTADGRRIFFPWGKLGRSYEVQSEEDYKTLRQRINIYTGIGLVLISAAIGLSGFLAAFIGLAVWTAFYAAWMRYLLPTLKPSNEKP
jgi:hypothetical protein